MTGLWFALAISFGFTFLLTALVIHLFIEVKAMNKSTHQVTYVPSPTKEQVTSGHFQTVTEEEDDKLKEQDDDLFGNIQ